MYRTFCGARNAVVSQATTLDHKKLLVYDAIQEKLKYVCENKTYQSLSNILV